MRSCRTTPATVVHAPGDIRVEDRPVEQVGDAVTSVSPGDFVVGSFVTSDNTCDICRASFQSSCVDRTFMSTTQAEAARARTRTARW